MAFVHPLDRKLIRDLWALRGQVVAVALVIASGLTVLIMSLGAISSLEETRAAFYDRYRFADIFARVERAPEGLARRIAAMPGVRAVETRVVQPVVLDVADMAEPVTGLLSSIPETRRPRLNDLVLRAGRWVRPTAHDEVILSEAFAQAHGLMPGDTLGAILNGTRRTLTVVGLALSPEYVYALAPGQLVPDDRSFGVLWMGRTALATAFDLDGAFNDVALDLGREAREADVIDRLDVLLARWGGVGAVGRADQTSNWFLSNEIAQLRTLATLLPTIFLMVAVFLLNVAAARIVALEQSQIGLLKAFGYGNGRIAWHYMKMMGAMAGIGVVLGWIGGAAMGRYVTELYAQFFHFPFLIYRPDPAVFALAGAVGLGAAGLGALASVRRAARLAPAQAMIPPAPPAYRRGLLSRALKPGRLDQPTLMVLRHVVRWPGRSAMTVLGIAMAGAIMVLALQWVDSVEELVNRQFNQEQRYDALVTFTDVRSASALEALRHMPGVIAAEPLRAVPARLSNGARERREGITGLPAAPALSRVLDTAGRAVTLPAEGVVLSTALARRLGVGVGDRVTAEIEEGRRPVLDLPVTAVVETYVGAPAWMEINALSRALKEGPTISGAALLVDPARADAFNAALKQTPAVAGVLLKKTAVDTFRATVAETMYIMIGFYVAFAGLLTFGVVYNAARIALSERGRELASLRVLGFSRGEVSYILLGELALLTLAAIPLGWWTGTLLAEVMSASMDTELFRIPVAIRPATYGWAALGLVAGAAASGLVVARKIRRLDLIAVLKTRE